MLVARDLDSKALVEAKTLKRHAVEHGIVPVDFYRCAAAGCDGLVRGVGLKKYHKGTPHFTRFTRAAADPRPHAAGCPLAAPVERTRHPSTVVPAPAPGTRVASDVPTELVPPGAAGGAEGTDGDLPANPRHGPGGAADREPVTTGSRVDTVHAVASVYLPARAVGARPLRVRDVEGTTYDACFRPFDPGRAAAGEYRLWYAPLRWSRTHADTPGGLRLRLAVRLEDLGYGGARLGHIVLDRHSWTPDEIRRFDESLTNDRAAAYAAWAARRGRRRDTPAPGPGDAAPSAGAPPAPGPVGTVWVCVLGAPGQGAHTITVQERWKVACFLA